MEETKIRRVEISFGVAVNLPDGWEKALDGLISMVCEQYQRENPTRMMWPAGVGSKPRWSQADAAFLGKDTDADAPAGGEPTFDETVFCIDCEEREDYHGSNRHNPDREAIRQRLSDERRAAKALRNGSRPSALGVGRDPEDANTLTVTFDKRPTDDDLRALHDGLR